jgi:hypothetical protein
MKNLAVVLLPLLACFGALRAHAGTTVAALQTTNGTAFTWRNIIGANQSATIGWSFQVGAEDLELDALGIFDLDGDGLDDAHPVGIWTSGGALLSQVTVPAGTTGTLVGGYRYESVTPITLIAGSTYFIGTYFGPVVDRCGTACGDASLAFGSETYAPGITFLLSNQTRAIIGAGTLTFPNLDAQIAQGFFGPNFLLSAPSAATTPEPASLWFAALGIAATLIRAFRR